MLVAVLLCDKHRDVRREAHGLNGVERDMTDVLRRERHYVSIQNTVDGGAVI